jgi:hypothetical protein
MRWPAADGGARCRRRAERRGEGFGSKDLLLLEALRWSEAAPAEERRALLTRRLSAERKLDLFLDLYLPRGRFAPLDVSACASELLALLDG